MLKNEFINMCIQDAGTDENLLAVVELFKEVVPDNVEIDSSKNPKGFYDHMEEYAKKNQVNNSYCITPSLAKKLAFEYLEIKESSNKKSSEIINLEDFF